MAFKSAKEIKFQELSEEKKTNVFASKAMAALLTATTVFPSLSMLGNNSAANDAPVDNIEATAGVSDLDRIAKLLAEKLEAQILANQADPKVDFTLDLDLAKLMKDDPDFKDGDLALVGAMTPEEVDVFLETVKSHFPENIRKVLTLNDEFKTIIQNIAVPQPGPDKQLPFAENAVLVELRTPETVGAADFAINNPNEKIGDHTVADLWRAYSASIGFDDMSIRDADNQKEAEAKQAKDKGMLLNCSIECLADVEENGKIIYPANNALNGFGEKLSALLMRSDRNVKFGNINVSVDQGNKDKINIKIFDYDYKKYAGRNQDASADVEKGLSPDGVIRESLSVPTGVFQGSLGAKLSDAAFSDMAGSTFLGELKAYNGVELASLIELAARNGDMSLLTEPLRQVLPTLECYDQTGRIAGAHIEAFRAFRPDLTSSQAANEITAADVIQIRAISYLARTQPEVLKQYMLQLNVGPRQDVADCVKNIANMYGVTLAKQEIKYVSPLAITVQNWNTATQFSAGNFDPLGGQLTENARATFDGVELLVHKDVTFDNVEKNNDEHGYPFSDFGMIFSGGPGVTIVDATATDEQFEIFDIEGTPGFEGFTESFATLSTKVEAYAGPLSVYGSARILFNPGRGANVDNFISKGQTYAALGATAKIVNYNFDANSFIGLTAYGEYNFNDLNGNKATDDRANLNNESSIFSRPVLLPGSPDYIVANRVIETGKVGFEQTDGWRAGVKIQGQYNTWSGSVGVDIQKTNVGVPESFEPFTDNAAGSPLPIDQSAYRTNVNISLTKQFGKATMTREQLKLQEWKRTENDSVVSEGRTSEYSNTGPTKTDDIRLNRRGNRALFELNKEDAFGTRESRNEAARKELEARAQEHMDQLKNESVPVIGGTPDGP